jgi:iron complex transport system ATP-binding protein
MTRAYIRSRDLLVRFRSGIAVNRVSLSLLQGRVVAVVGPNGAGKSTLLKALVGILPSSGEIHVDGVSAASLSKRELAKRLAYLPQGHAAYWPLPVREVVTLGRYPHRGSGGTLSDADAVQRALTLTDLVKLSDRPVTELSGGERSRVAIARVLASNAPAVLADEPTASLDPLHQIEAMRLLRDSAKGGSLVVVVTHDIGLAARFADEIIVMREGDIFACGPPQEALDASILRTVFGIEAFRETYGGSAVIVPWSAA